jgi:hypothetical protein
MTDLLAQVLPVAVGAAISPAPTTVCILLLTSRRPLPNAVAFLVGNGLVFVAIGTLALAVFGGEPLTSDRSSTTGHTIDAVLGVLFLMFAFKRYLYVPDPDAPPPKWMTSLDLIAPGKSFVFGALMMGTNFTTLALYVSGLKDIVLARAGALSSITAFALLVLIVMSGLLAPIVLYTIAPHRVAAVLDFVSEWLERNNRAIAIVFFALFGALLLVRGFSSVL